MATHISLLLEKEVVVQLTELTKVMLSDINPLLWTYGLDMAAALILEVMLICATVFLASSASTAELRMNFVSMPLEAWLAICFIGDSLSKSR